MINSVQYKESEATKSLWHRLWTVPKGLFLRFDRRLDGAISFFIKHYGKTKFMLAMSKRSQTLGLERLFLKGPKAFIYFFLFFGWMDVTL